MGIFDSFARKLSNSEEYEEVENSANVDDEVDLHPVFEVQHNNVTSLNLKVHYIKKLEDLYSQGVARDYKERCTVVINFERTDSTIIGRTLDFMGGIVFALNGRQVQMGEKIYAFLPCGVKEVVLGKDEETSGKSNYKRKDDFSDFTNYSSDFKF